MKEINDGGPAFPVAMVPWQDGFINVECTGMSLRDWFAGQVLQGLASDGERYKDKFQEEIAVECYEMADEMIAERESKNV